MIILLLYNIINNNLGPGILGPPYYYYTWILSALIIETNESMNYIQLLYLVVELTYIILRLYNTRRINITEQSNYCCTVNG